MPAHPTPGPACAIRWLLTLAVTLAAAACGGGGDDGNSGGASAERAATSAEGYYVGTVSAGAFNQFELLALENNEFWLLYGNRAPGSSRFTVSGFMQGTGTYSAGTFTSTAMRNYGASPVTTGTFGATFRTNTSSFTTSLTGTASAATVSLSMTGADNISNYLYGLPASPSALAGTWTISLGAGQSATLVVNPAGAFTLTLQGCVSTGSMLPRASGKNVFNLTLTTGTATCASPGVTYTGVAYVSSIGLGNANQLTLLARNTAQTAGLVLVGDR
ncbi:MAG: hypothetical protein JNJ89_04030 [Rubrivivax sp.]|nr:hypothetical protein [Rubrivivax sp.]